MSTMLEEPTKRKTGNSDQHPSPKECNNSFPSFTPKDYALAVFGEAVSGDAIIGLQPHGSGRKPKDIAGNAEWNNACQRVRNILSFYNIQADICHTPFLASNYNFKIPVSNKRVGCACRFFCTKCSEQEKAALVAVGIFSHNKDGNYLEMQYLFPHNANCQSETPTVLVSPYTVVDFDFDTVIGTTYAAALAEVGKQNNGRKKKTKLLGSRINLDNPKHNTDDRSYFALPRTTDTTDTIMAHKHCMTRLFLHMAVKLNLVVETTAQLFDWPAVARGKLEKKESWQNYPVKVNAAAHLFLSEISLLFGGHHLHKKKKKKKGDLGDLVHQTCHMDCYGLDGNADLEGKSKPSSIMLPLEDSSRFIWDILGLLDTLY
jgi:hypothetical protein